MIHETSTNSSFSTTHVTAWINAAIEKMNLTALYNEQVLALSTTNGTRSVALPSGFMAMKEVLYTDSSITKEVMPVDYSAIAWDYSTVGVPEFYTIRAGLIYFDPIPSSTSATVTGSYVKAETALSGGTDTPAMDADFHFYIVHGAVALCLVSDGQVEAAQYHVKEFEDGARKLTERYWDDRVRNNGNLFRLKQNAQ